MQIVINVRWHNKKLRMWFERYKTQKWDKKNKKKPPEQPPKVKQEVLAM